MTESALQIEMCNDAPLDVQLSTRLMPLQGGEITLPNTPYSTFYLSQRPYLISGSLRDQILYPHPPAAVWEAASPEARAPFEQLPIAPLSEQERDERLEAVIEAVELDYLLGRWAAQHLSFPKAFCLSLFHVRIISHAP